MFKNLIISFIFATFFSSISNAAPNHCQSNFNLNLPSGSLIAHASGGLNNLIYLNSEESFNHSYKLGYKFFEVDLLLTSDGYFVGTHSWNDWKRIHKINKLSSIPSYKEIIEINKTSKYKTITEDYLKNIMIKNPEIILVTDKVTNYSLLAKRIPFLKRMLVEVFDKAGLKRAKDAGFTFLMPSYVHNPNEIIELLKTTNIRYFAIHSATFNNSFKGDVLRELISKGACIALYSSNISKYAVDFFALGGFALYSDFIPQKNFKYNCKGIWCKTY